MCWGIAVSDLRAGLVFAVKPRLLQSRRAGCEENLALLLLDRQWCWLLLKLRVGKRLALDMLTLLRLIWNGFDVERRQPSIHMWDIMPPQNGEVCFHDCVLSKRKRFLSIPVSKGEDCNNVTAISICIHNCTISF